MDAAINGLNDPMAVALRKYVTQTMYLALGIPHYMDGDVQDLRTLLAARLHLRDTLTRV